MLLLLLSIFAIFAIPLKIKLENLAAENFATLTALAEEHNEQTQKFQKFNKKIEMLEQVKNQNFAWDQLLGELASLTPENVALIELTASSQSKQANLTGFARRREDLIAFQEELKNSGLFANLESPLENYLERENFEFQLKDILK